MKLQRRPFHRGVIAVCAFLPLLGPNGDACFGSRIAVDTVVEGKRKISPTTRTRTVLIADIMMLEREAALKPAR
jgi:hypothetical protein